jgi:phosphoglycolate phosphatase
MSAPRSGRDAMKLVIFDVDGTLVDSQHFIVEAQTRAFAAHGLPAPSRAEMLSIVGLSLVQAFEQLVPDGPAASLAQAYRDAWSVMRLDPDYADEMYPGAVEAVNALAQRDDLLLGIATGKSLRGVHHLFDERGWHGRFATVQTSDGHPSKPHPAMVLKALAETGLAPAAGLALWLAPNMGTTGQALTAAAGTLQYGSNNSQSQRTPAAKAIRAALIDASNYVSCVLSPRDGCQEVYRAQDQQRRERTQGVLRLE